MLSLCDHCAHGQRTIAEVSGFFFGRFLAHSRIRCVSDLNYMKIWDLHLSRASEESISDTAKLRWMVYFTRHIPNQNEVEVSRGGVCEDRRDELTRSM
jgi:hypothetical protein